MGNAVSVVKLYKSGGVAQRSTSSRQQARSARIKEYFYGPDGSLQPVSVDLDATNMRVFRSGELGMRLTQTSEVSKGNLSKQAL
jgi:polyribonucleotide 5'-hydroxyl-kinase